MILIKTCQLMRFLQCDDALTFNFPFFFTTLIDPFDIAKEHQVAHHELCTGISRSYYCRH